VRKHGLKVDYEKYIINQIMKPVSQMFELVIEKLPNFPHGRGYFEEIENIWYNKYNGDEVKTEKKIKQLKQKMVQKLVFDQLIQYVYMKDRKGKTIDQWFEPVGKDESVIDSVQQIKPKEKPSHIVTIKKSKQSSLDAFFK
jgi:hypothetical protein